MNQRHHKPDRHVPAREESWLFQDREDSGARLAEGLLQYRGKGALVVGMAPGGVAVARSVAQRLGSELDVIVAHKLGAPGQEELALGAITADGSACLHRELILQLGLPDASLEHVADEQRTQSEQREQRLRRGLVPLDPGGRIAIVVDDGLATDVTLRAAIRSLRKRRATKVVAAVPVGAADGCELVAGTADELLCPHRPEQLDALGAYYRTFDPTSDDDVARILTAHRARRVRRESVSAHSPRL